jgi:hypothetical protein
MSHGLCIPSAVQEEVRLVHGLAVGANVTHISDGFDRFRSLYDGPGLLLLPLQAKFQFDLTILEIIVIVI